MKPKTNTKNKAVSFWVTEKEHEQFAEVARRDGRSLSAWIRKIITAAIAARRS
jgi:predicted HicB family RNase H-like nuclease